MYRTIKSVSATLGTVYRIGPLSEVQFQWFDSEKSEIKDLPLNRQTAPEFSGHLQIIDNIY